MNTTAHTHDSVTLVTASRRRRADVGAVWLTRDGIYLTSPAARSVVTRVAASLPPAEQARVVVRDLPGYAFAPEQLR
jgi:hypothetical protein